MKITKHRQVVECVHYSHDFRLHTEPGCGYSFSCDEHGVIDEASLTPVQCRSLQIARDESKYSDIGLVTANWRYIEPAEGLCGCGETVILDGFTNTCGCGIDYDSSGQALAPRSCWGEETGEHWTDCV